MAIRNLPFGRHDRGGLSKLPEYNAWKSMRVRCLYPTSPAYKYYGGRGIRVCDEWVDSFDAFLRDMGARPSREYSLDRIDNNGNYCKENCRWATKKQQMNNRRPDAFHCEPRVPISGYRGVHRSNRVNGMLSGKLWRAQIGRKHLGSFHQPEDAATVWNFAAYEKYGDGATFNLPNQPKR